MIIKGSQLRSISRRFVATAATHGLNPRSTAIVFPEFEMRDADGKLCKRVEAGERVTLSSTHPIGLLGNKMAFIHINPAIHEFGAIHGPTLLVPDDPAGPVRFVFSATKRMDASQLGYLFDLRVVE